MSQMEAQFDCFMPEDDYRRLPDPSPIAKLCEEMDLNPVDVLVHYAIHHVDVELSN